MNYEQAYQHYNGAIPDELRKTFIYGNIEKYALAFLITAERNFMRRFQEILQSLCVWRRTKRYPELIQLKMLKMLSHSLYQARDTAFSSWAQLPSNSSASAVIAPPINTA